MGTTASKARAAAAANDVPLLQQVAATHPRALLSHSLWKQRSALHAAARAGATEALCGVLDVAAHTHPTSLLAFLNAPDYAGDTALALACKHGYDDCARELLEAGASPLPANGQGVTALHYAASRGHAVCMRLLLSTTVRLADGTRCPAAQAPVPDVVDLERYIDTRSLAGLCALHLAVLSGSSAAVAELVNHGAQLDTPLLTLSFRGPPLMPALAAGSTALHMAAATGRLPLCLLILHAQQQRHPGLELRRMRNARGMTPLNVALVCDHRNLASLLSAGAPVPAPLPPHRGHGARGSAQLPPLLRQQLLALVHRAALLSRLRELGLGAAAAAEAPPLPGLAAGPIARLESLLHSNSATASQVLAEVDDLLDEAAAAAGGSGGGDAGGGAAPPHGASSSSAQRRRSRRRQQERDAAAATQASTQAGVDWTLLERNRSLWHAEHAGPGLYHRLHRRRERQQQRQAAAGAPSAVAAAPVPQSLPAAAQQELILASALLQQSSEEEERGGRRRGSRAAGAGGASSSSQRSSSRSPSSGSLAGAGGAGASAAAASEMQQEQQQQQQQQEEEEQQQQQQQQQQVAASCSSSQADSALCPICLDLPADVAILPCRHRACLGCCARLAAWCPASSSAAFGLPTTGPLCPLCRTGIDSFAKTA